MTTAAVGFQCPACVAEGRATVRRVKIRKPLITQIIIGICVAAFGLEMLTGRDFAWNFGIAGAAITQNGEYYRFLTSMFLHVDIIHIAFNMLILYQFGSALETLMGSPRFALLYLGGGLGGGLASILFNDPYTLSVGASGAIFGLLGAYVIYAMRARLDTNAVVIMIGINLVLGFVLPGIDWHAHLGGLVVGAILGSALTPSR
jgi:membrane associated rhomboid family serine protease